MLFLFFFVSLRRNNIITAMKRLLLMIVCCLMAGSTTLFAQKSQRVTVGKVTFQLAPDYSVKARSTLKNGETCLITPKTDANGVNNRLILKIHPNALTGINGMTSEEVGDMLRKAVDDLAGVMANEKKSGFKLDRKYKIHYDDNANNSYHPYCYSYLSWTDRQGKRSYSYTEAALVKGKIVSGSAIATDEAELAALQDIFMEVVAGADK